MQPIHKVGDLPWYKDRLGQNRIDRAYAWKSLLNKGVKLAFGSDTPVEDVNPLLGILSATTTLSLKEAFTAYHEGAAFAEFNEKNKGKIEKGYFADFIVYDKNILNKPKKDIYKTVKPFMTVINGKVVYDE